MVNNIAALLKRVDGAFKIDGVPKCDGDSQIPLASTGLVVKNTIGTGQNVRAARFGKDLVHNYHG